MTKGYRRMDDDWGGGRRGASGQSAAPRAGLRDTWGPRIERDEPERGAFERSLAVSAKTLAGIGLGLLGVIVGTSVAGLVLEAMIVPGLLTKLAAGVAGGGLGLARGLGDEHRLREERGRGPRE